MFERNSTTAVNHICLFSMALCLIVITARNEVGQCYVFTRVCDSVHRGEVEGSGRGVSPGPYPGRRLRGLAGGSPGPHLGRVARLTPGRWCVSQHALRQIPSADGYCCGWYASYWNAFFFEFYNFLIESR